MQGNAKDKLKKAADELCCAHEHLSTAYMKAEETQNRTEVHAALKSVAGAIENIHCTLHHYKD